MDEIPPKKKGVMLSRYIKKREESNVKGQSPESPWVVFYRMSRKDKLMKLEVKYNGRFYRGEVKRDDDYVGKI